MGTEIRKDLSGGHTEFSSAAGSHSMGKRVARAATEKMGVCMMMMRLGVRRSGSKD